MNRFCVFAGTLEGREIIEYLCGQDAEVSAFVATDYAVSLLPEKACLTVSRGRLSGEEITEILGKEQFDLVIDATHPYAAAVTENVRSACQRTGTEYLRLLRPADACPEDAVLTESAEEAAACLAGTKGNILLTTGAGHLSAFAGIPDFSERVYARILPQEESLLQCRQAGLTPSRIIAMQGPFSAEMNEALIRCTNARYVVSKMSGTPGGFEEKVLAAQAAGAKLVLIGRPSEEEGYTLEETLLFLKEKFGLQPAPDTGTDAGAVNGTVSETGTGEPLPAPSPVIVPGLPDECFLRKEGIPMTKCEIRAVLLSKLHLIENGIFWDIGAGTGSVAIEMARLAPKSRVFAVEMREDAAELIRQNAARLGVSNIAVITGEAPAALEGLPAPTHVFIGGSSGNLREILRSVRGRAPEAVIAATAVTLETQAQLTAFLDAHGGDDDEILSIQVSRSTKAGSLHLMRAQNPVFLYVFRGGRRLS